jgi:hypothetical protein
MNKKCSRADAIEALRSYDNTRENIYLTDAVLDALLAPLTASDCFKVPEVKALIDMAENVKYATPEYADRAVKVLEPFVAASWEEYDKEDKR